MKFFPSNPARDRRAARLCAAQLACIDFWEQVEIGQMPRGPWADVRREGAQYQGRPTLLTARAELPKDPRLAECYESRAELVCAEIYYETQPRSDWAPAWRAVWNAGHAVVHASRPCSRGVAAVA